VEYGGRASNSCFGKGCDKFSEVLSSGIGVLNLGIFTAATQFLQASRASPQKQEYLTCIMIGSAFAAFCAVLLYHCYQAVKNKGILQYILSHYPQRRVQLEDRSGNEIAPVVPQPTVSVIELNVLHEPLLTEN